MNGATIVRRAVRSDVPAMASLHEARITEGFLTSLGAGFLRRLYLRVVRSSDTAPYVAVRDDGEVVGFAAACCDVGALYRRFLLRDAVGATLAAAPKLLGAWRRVLETLRYPAHDDDLPAAEILAVAVVDEAGGRGVGRALVDAVVRDLTRRGVRAMKVVAGADNDAARALYLGSGFRAARSIEVHDGVTSVVYVRTAVVGAPSGRHA